MVFSSIFLTISLTTIDEINRNGNRKEKIIAEIVRGIGALAMEEKTKENEFFQTYS